MEHIKYKCIKCSGTEYETGEIRAAGGFWTKIFNIQNRSFKTVSCSHCGYTEIYSNRKSGTGENILDFFTN